jgi:hypothetical protein
MNGENVDDYVKAMKLEIAQLVKYNTWEVTPRSGVPRMPDGTEQSVLKGTWAFKMKGLIEITQLVKHNTCEVTTRSITPRMP